MSLSPLSKFAVAALLLGGSAVAAKAEFQKYNYDNAGGWISGFWVDDFGRHVVKASNGVAPQFTSIYSQGIRTDYSIDTRGVSSDGRVFGSTIGSNGKSAAAYLDFSGQLNLFSLPSSSWGSGGSSYIDLMNGSYTSVISEGGPASPAVPELYRHEIYENVNYLHGIESEYSIVNVFSKKLASNGNLNLLTVDPNNYILKKPNGEETILLNYEGTGSLQGWQGSNNYTAITDISDNGLMLLTYGTVGSNLYRQKIYDPVNEVFTDVISDMGVRRINNNGDLLSYKGSGSDSRYVDMWIRRKGEDWLNASELSGMGSILWERRSIHEFDLTNSGHIYGLIGSSGTTAFNVGYVMNPVPEPGTMLLLAAGASGLIAARRRKKQA